LFKHGPDFLKLNCDPPPALLAGVRIHSEVRRFDLDPVFMALRVSWQINDKQKKRDQSAASDPDESVWSFCMKGSVTGTLFGRQ
jgi:hypothetical protein